MRVQDGQLERQYTPGASLKDARAAQLDVDAVTALYHHLNHRRNAAMLPPLLQAAHAIGPPAARLLKLLAHALYTPELYSEQPATIARGAFAIVQQRYLQLPPGSAADRVAVAEKARSSLPRPAVHSCNPSAALCFLLVPRTCHACANLLHSATAESGQGITHALSSLDILSLIWCTTAH